jgi:hypothetical protein
LAELDRFLTAQLKKDEMSVSGSVGSGDVIGVEFLFQTHTGHCRFNCFQRAAMRRL